MRPFKTLVAALVLLLGAAGCAQHVEDMDLTAFNQERPRSILVVPPRNASTQVDAPDTFLSTITVPIAEKGYYAFPVHTVKRVLEDNGLSDAELVHGAPPERLGAMFGADAILYPTILEWDSKYLVLSTTTIVQLNYRISSGKTGETLWDRDYTITYSPQNSSSGNPFVDLAVMAVTAAVERAAPSYVPLAQQANYQALYTPQGQAVPNGPYLLPPQE